MAATGQVDRPLARACSGTTVSGVVARITQVAIILFFAIAAARLLGFPELTVILDRVLELDGRVARSSQSWQQSS